MTPLGDKTSRNTRGGRRGTLTRGWIFETALTVVDADGIDALTMRRVATELDVDPMALYRHVEGKDALLDGVVEALWRDVSPPPESPAAWAESLRSFAHALRDAVNTHPLAAPLLLIRPTIPRSALEAYDALLGILRDAGFSDSHATRIVRSVTWTALSHAIGTATYRTLTRSVAGQPSRSETDAWISLVQTLPKDTPAEFVRAAYAMCEPAEADADFTFVLDLILQGAADLMSNT